MAKKVLISLPEKLLKKVDDHIKSLGYGISRSGFIKEALENKLKQEVG